jgi:integrase
MKNALESSTPLGPSMAPITKNRHLSTLAAIFTFANKEGYVQHPGPMGAWRRQSDDTHARDKRIPFTDEQVRTIFAMFWITAIAAFSGMRLGEITQLRANDIGSMAFTTITVNTDEGKSSPPVNLSEQTKPSAIASG